MSMERIFFEFVGLGKPLKLRFPPDGEFVYLFDNVRKTASTKTPSDTELLFRWNGTTSLDGKLTPQHYRMVPGPQHVHTVQVEQVRPQSNSYLDPSVKHTQPSTSEEEGRKNEDIRDLLSTYFQVAPQENQPAVDTSRTHSVRNVDGNSNNEQRSSHHRQRVSPVRNRLSPRNLSTSPDKNQGSVAKHPSESSHLEEKSPPRHIVALRETSAQPQESSYRPRNVSPRQEYQLRHSSRSYVDPHYDAAEEALSTPVLAHQRAAHGIGDNKGMVEKVSNELYKAEEELQRSTHSLREKVAENSEQREVIRNLKAELSVTQRELKTVTGQLESERVTSERLRIQVRREITHREELSQLSPVRHSTTSSSTADIVNSPIAAALRGKGEGIVSTLTSTRQHKHEEDTLSFTSLMELRKQLAGYEAELSQKDIEIEKMRRRAREAEDEYDRIGSQYKDLKAMLGSHRVTAQEDAEDFLKQIQEWKTKYEEKAEELQKAMERERIVSQQSTDMRRALNIAQNDASTMQAKMRVSESRTHDIEQEMGNLREEKEEVEQQLHAARSKLSCLSGESVGLQQQFMQKNEDLLQELSNVKAEAESSTLELEVENKKHRGEMSSLRFEIEDLSNKHRDVSMKYDTARVALRERNETVTKLEASLVEVHTEFVKVQRELNTVKNVYGLTRGNGVHIGSGPDTGSSPSLSGPTTLAASTQHVADTTTSSAGPDQATSRIDQRVQTSVVHSRRASGASTADQES